MSKIFPTQMDIFIVADSVRQESGGKVSLLGVFAGGRIVIGSNQRLPAPIPLAFYCLFSSGEGEFAAKAKIHTPSKGEIGPFDLPGVTKIPNQSITMLLNFPIIVLPDLGKYVLEIFLDDKSYKDEFSLEQTDHSVT